MPKTPQQVANDKDALDAKRMELDEAIEQANIANANVERLRREFNELQTVSFYLIIFSRFFYLLDYWINLGVRPLYRCKIRRRIDCDHQFPS